MRIKKRKNFSTRGSRSGKEKNKKRGKLFCLNKLRQEDGEKCECGFEVLVNCCQVLLP